MRLARLCTGVRTAARCSSARTWCLEVLSRLPPVMPLTLQEELPLKQDEAAAEAQQSIKHSHTVSAHWFGDQHCVECPVAAPLAIKCIHSIAGYHLLRAWPPCAVHTIVQSSLPSRYTAAQMHRAQALRGTAGCTHDLGNSHCQLPPASTTGGIAVRSAARQRPPNN